MTTRARLRPRLPSPRGQNMVLLALSMLFLALMVTVTLGLGMRVRQNHELQHLADASAYSNAVMTARAYNNASIINRLEVSYFVSQSADQSLISWTTYSRAAVNAAALSSIYLLLPSIDGCQPNNGRALQAYRAFSRVRSEEFTPATEYDNLDTKAGSESRNIQLAIAMLRNELRPWTDSVNPQNLRKRLYDDVESQRLSRQVLLAAGVPGVQVVEAPPASGTPRGAPAVNRRELDCDYGFVDSPLNDGEPPGPGLCMRYSWSTTMLDAAMGSRGSPFVTRRGEMPAKMEARLKSAARSVPGTTLTLQAPTGSGYWAASKTHGNAPIGKEAWGDDHGSLGLTIVAPGNACSGSVSVNVESFVKSTHIDESTDQHDWTPGFEDTVPAEVVHTMASCQPLCPSVWVRTMGFQPRDSADDAWGQPKQLVAVERDNTVQRFPWELHFSFPFSATGPAREWDGRGEALRTGGAAGLNVRRSVAMATGMTYYHRREHWDEPPNLLNPFWRATLAPADVDRGAGGNADVGAALTDAKYRWQREAYDSLVSAGYKGLH